MKINKKVEGKCLTISLEGRLDTNTSSELEKEISNLDDIEVLIFDFEKLEYISSAGLRIILSCQKKMNLHGNMIVENANPDIKDIFDITGFSDIITIQ